VREGVAAVDVCMGSGCVWVVDVCMGVEFNLPLLHGIEGMDGWIVGWICCCLSDFLLAGQ